MNEAFLHFIWKNQLFPTTALVTSEGERIDVRHPGIHNRDAGPDFFDARVRIGQTLWAGNVEIHYAASEWYNHGHDGDPNYANVILHVVVNNDRLVMLGRSPVPTMTLQIDEELLVRYQNLMNSGDWIACQGVVRNFEPYRLKFFLSRLMVERLQHKTDSIKKALNDTCSDWSESFYRIMARAFGFRVNSEPMEQLARALPQKILAHHQSSLMQIEALLFGQAGFLGEELFGDAYYLRLRDEYRFLAGKYNLKPLPKHRWKFLRMRPVNFPTIRLAQFAQLIFQSKGLFSATLEAANIADLSSLYSVSVSDYWETHYDFNKPSPKKSKRLGKVAFESIVINVVVPFYFQFGESQNKLSLKEKALSLLEQLPPEDNTIIRHWSAAGIVADTAHETQALMYLKSNYCDRHRCLDCQVGHNLIVHEQI